MNFIDVFLSNCPLDVESNLGWLQFYLTLLCLIGTGILCHPLNNQMQNYKNNHDLTIHLPMLQGVCLLSL